MHKDYPPVRSNLDDLDPTLFLRRLAWFLTAAISDGSFVITVQDDDAVMNEEGRPLTAGDRTATLPLNPPTKKGAYECYPSPDLRPGEFQGTETTEPGPAR
jgi:hypothetical protein